MLNVPVSVSLFKLTPQFYENFSKVIGMKITLTPYLLIPNNCVAREPNF